MSKELGSEYYDTTYATGGADAIYDLPYWHSGYYPLFLAVWRSVAERRGKAILEVGCGTGAFGHLCLREGADRRYSGFDFSPVAVARAAARTQRPELFRVGDARDPANYRGDFDTIVCTEVLEHIDADLEVIGHWPAGTQCVCSVPNFDADGHVRHFETPAAVRARYGELIDIDELIQVKKPFLNNLSRSHLLDALRWNRYRPSRLLAILGLASFERLGGWYLFSGTRRPT